MCIWAAIAAGVVAAIAAQKQANTENAVSEYQGRVAANNAQVAEWQAEDAKSRGDLSASQSTRKYQQLQGSQVASFAAKGMDVSYGSPNAILTDTDYFGAYDENVVRANSRREAWGYQVQADNYMNQHQFLKDQREMNNPFVAGIFGFAKGFVGAGGASGMGGGGASGGQQSSMLTDQGLVASRWYGSGSAYAGSPTSGYGDFARDYYGG
jgi:hypothetical protein